MCVPRTWFAGVEITVFESFAITCAWHSSHVYVVYVSMWTRCRADSPVLLTAAVTVWHDVHVRATLMFHASAGALYAPPTGAAFEWQ